MDGLDKTDRVDRAAASRRWEREGRTAEVVAHRDKVRREARANGATKAKAREEAWEAALAEFPPSEPEPNIARLRNLTVPQEDDPNGVSGLGDISEDWPKDMPANADLSAEVAWVSANRLRVRSGDGVDLSLALSPAVSHG